MWVWEVWGACVAVSAFGELLQSVLILNWRCTVEGCLDRFLFTGRWHEKRSLLSLDVLQEILESSGGLGELLGILERPWKNCGSVLAFFVKSPVRVFSVFLLRTYFTVSLFFLLSLLRKSWFIFTRVGEH